MELIPLDDVFSIGMNLDWKGDRKQCSRIGRIIVLVGCTFDRNIPSHVFDDEVVRHMQAKPGPLKLMFGREIWIEYFVKILFGYASGIIMEVNDDFY